MKVSELLATVSDNMPSDISDGSIINWINYLEDDVYSRIVDGLNAGAFISEDGLSENTHYRPVLKELSKAHEQELSIEKYGYRWLLLYEYYIYAQIALLKEEFGKSNNYIMLFNTLLDDFFAFYNSRHQTDREWR